MKQHPMQQKIESVLSQLNHGLVEREHILKTALLTLLAGENLVLIGPPGTGKSLVARRLTKAFALGGEQEGGYFEYLLTKFSTPEEIFGPLSITELKANRFRRNTVGYLPMVRFAFLDEIFKASSSILNALLTILNERKYHNGSQAEDVPLQGLIAASNELPNDQDELAALYDRFLVRCFVDYVRPENREKLFETPRPLPTVRGVLDAADLAAIHDAAHAVTVPPTIVEAMQCLWAQHQESFKEDRREYLSDRRLKKVLQLMRVSAATNGRKEVDLSDVFLLKDCLWNHANNAPKLHNLILSVLKGFSYPVPKTHNPAHPASAKPATLATSANPSARSNNKFKDFKGSGTAHDPILIETLAQLVDLDRPEIGQQGYFFRQTADLDCSKLNTWLRITLKGHYHGDGHVIRGKNAGRFPLFASVEADSHITNLELHGIRLADHVKEARIVNCIFKDPWIGGMVNQMTNSLIERCYFAGSLLDELGIHFVAVTPEPKGCTIRHCALGRLESGRYTIHNCSITPQPNLAQCVENNVSIDVNKINGGVTGAKLIDAALFKQRYFENTLGWDFDTVWTWDSQNDQPALRSMGSAAKHASSPKASPDKKANTTDLLVQQIHANIWL